jgi:hypothetical protein
MNLSTPTPNAMEGWRAAADSRKIFAAQRRAIYEID